KHCPNRWRGDDFPAGIGYTIRSSGPERPTGLRERAAWLPPKGKSPTNLSGKRTAAGKDTLESRVGRTAARAEGVRPADRVPAGRVSQASDRGALTCRNSAAVGACLEGRLGRHQPWHP